MDRDERLLEVEVDDCDKRRLEVDLLDLLRLMVCRKRERDTSTAWLLYQRVTSPNLNFQRVEEGHRGSAIGSGGGRKLGKQWNYDGAYEVIKWLTRIPGPRFNALVTSATFCFSQMSPCRVARSGCSGLESGRFG